MRFIEMRRLNGPNVFTSVPVCIARLELDELTCRETTEFDGFADRLCLLLPGLAGHHCAAGRPGGFLEAMARGTYFGHVAEHVALELSGLAGREVHLGRTMWAGADGRYDLMMECPADEPADSRVPAALLTLAVRVVHEFLADDPGEPIALARFAASAGSPGEATAADGVTSDADMAGAFTTELASELERIGGTCERERLGVSTAAIAAAARRRGIPVRRIGSRSMLRLGHGCHRKLACAALTSQTSAVGVDVAADKQLSKQVLSAAGIPVAAGVVAYSASEAAAALAELGGGPVVVKPLGGNQGANLTIGVRTAAEAALAYDKAAEAGAAVLVEELVPGNDYRVLVIDGHIAAAAQLRPAAVTGDGAHTISQLVTDANLDPRRGRGHSRELTKIKLDADALSHLDSIGLDDHSVPAAGQLVTLRRNANLSTGGTSKDVTDVVHQQVADMCRRAAAATGLDICGIDLRLADIAAPLHHPSAHGPAQPCAVLELNACPGLRMHLSPAEGTPRDVAAAVVDSLYPPGAAARIPVISVTGTNGKTTTTRMVGHVLSQAGVRVGMSCTEGVFVSGELVYDADASGPRSAEMVLDDPAVEAAVLETARGGIIRCGLGYDLADVAVITNISADHLGSDGVDTMDELINVKALVAEQVREGGSIVLNADDPAVAALADRPAVRARRPVIRYFSARMAAASAASDLSSTGNETASDRGRDILARHKAAGGTCYEVIDGHLAETEGTDIRPLIDVAELPGAFGGRAAHLVANALAAAAACRAAGISLKDIRQALLAFTPVEANPGRGNVFRAGRSPVIVDYGHNAAAMAATGRFVAEVFGSAGDAVAALTLPGDRRDDLVRQTAAELAAWFGTVVLYEDSDKRGRQAGEMLELVRSALTAARPDIVCEEAENPADALRTALRLAADGAPVLFVYEKMELARDALAAVGAEPWAGPTADAGPGKGTDLAPPDAGGASTGNATQATAEPTAVGADAAVR